MLFPCITILHSPKPCVKAILSWTVTLRRKFVLKIPNTLVWKFLYFTLKNTKSSGELFELHWQPEILLPPKAHLHFTKISLSLMLHVRLHHIQCEMSTTYKHTKKFKCYLRQIFTEEMKDGLWPFLSPSIRLKDHGSMYF